MKKILAMMLLFVVLGTMMVPLAGCKETAPSDDVLKEHVRELIPQTEVFVKLFFKEGLPADTGEAVEGYLPVNMDTMRLTYQFENLEDVFVAMETVWSAGYIQRFRARFTPSGAPALYAQEGKYCFDKYNLETKDYEGIWVSEKGCPYPTDDVEYLYDTMRVMEKTEQYARITMQVVVTNRENRDETLTKKINVMLTKDTESGTWLLDSGVAQRYFTTEEK